MSAAKDSRNKSYIFYLIILLEEELGNSIKKNKKNKKIKKKPTNYAFVSWVWGEFWKFGLFFLPLDLCCQKFQAEVG